MTDAELAAAMRARATAMDARAELLDRLAKRGAKESPGARRWSEMQRCANGLRSRAFYMRQSAASLETIDQVDG